MSIFITKIKLYNFRRFREFVIEPNTKNNILIIVLSARDLNLITSLFYIVMERKDLLPSKV